MINNIVYSKSQKGKKVFVSELSLCQIWRKRVIWEPTNAQKLNLHHSRSYCQFCAPSTDSPNCKRRTGTVRLTDLRLQLSIRKLTQLLLLSGSRSCSFYVRPKWQAGLGKYMQTKSDKVQGNKDYVSKVAKCKETRNMCLLQWHFPMSSITSVSADSQPGFRQDLNFECWEEWAGDSSWERVKETAGKGSCISFTYRQHFELP